MYITECLANEKAIKLTVKEVIKIDSPNSVYIISPTCAHQQLQIQSVTKPKHLLDVVMKMNLTYVISISPSNSGSAFRRPAAADAIYQNISNYIAHAILTGNFTLILQRNALLLGSSSLSNSTSGSSYRMRYQVIGVMNEETDKFNNAGPRSVEPAVIYIIIAVTLATVSAVGSIVLHRYIASNSQVLAKSLDNITSASSSTAVESCGTVSSCCESSSANHPL
jgi:hypothetical protein